MARVKGGTTARARRKKILKQTEGYFGSKHRLFKTAKEQLMHSWTYAYRDRKNKKRDFRKLWITRINAACRENGMSYSKFINGLNKAGITINRKMLSEIAIENPKSFKEMVSIAQDALDGKEYKPAVVEKTVKATPETKKEVVKKEAIKKETVKKETTKKPAAKTTAVKKTTTKKPTVKKATTTKSTTTKKPAAKKTTTKKTTK